MRLIDADKLIHDIKCSIICLTQEGKECKDIILKCIEKHPTALDMEEYEELKAYKDRMEMQFIDGITNPLEPLKLSSALQSEIRKYEIRKATKPQDISPLDITIMYALKHCLEEGAAE